VSHAAVQPEPVVEFDAVLTQAGALEIPEPDRERLRASHTPGATVHVIVTHEATGRPKESSYGILPHHAGRYSPESVTEVRAEMAVESEAALVEPEW